MNAWRIRSAALVAAATIALAAAGCGGSNGGSSGGGSGGGSSTQARSVIDGLDADVTTLASFLDTDAIRQRGLIKPGYAADLVVFDPKKTMTLGVNTLHMRVDYNPYEGREVTGVTDTVISRGKVVIDGGKFVGKAGAGSFLKRGIRS